MELNLSDYQVNILTGVLVSALNEAERDGRTGAWVQEVRAVLAVVNGAVNRQAPSAG